jgi:HlyD family secretion protein
VIVRRRDGAILRQLHALYNIGAVGDLTDGQLLERFANDTDEAAEIAVEEYRAINCPRDLAAVEGEIRLAQSGLTRAEDRFKSEKNSPSLELRSASERTVKAAQFTLQMAENKRKFFVDYTRDFNTKQLESDVAKARSDELAKKTTWELRQTIEMKLARELGLKAN